MRKLISRYRGSIYEKRRGCFYRDWLKRPKPKPGLEHDPLLVILGSLAVLAVISSIVRLPQIGWKTTYPDGREEITRFAGSLSQAQSAGIGIRTSCTPAAATSCTLLGAVQPGDVMISFAYKTSTTAPTAATGWTLLKTASASGNSYRMYWKYAVGNETNCGVWANATQTYCEVYYGAWITGGTLGGSFGNNTSGTTGSSTTVTLSALTLTNPYSSSWVVCAAGSVTGAVDQTVTGLTLRSGTSITNIGFWDTNGVVSSFTAKTMTISSSGWATACVELVGTPSTVSPITPSNYLVRELNYGITREGSTSDYHMTFPVEPANGTLANNFLMLHLDLGYGTAPTISNVYCNSDTGHATWTFTTISANDTTDATEVFDFYMANAPAGCKTITVVPSGAWTNAAARFRELRQIATSSPVDAHLEGQVTSNGLYVTMGAITPTQANDVIIQDCTAASMAGPTGGAASGNIFFSGNTTALDVFPVDSLSASGFVYNSTSAITVTHAMTSPYSPNSACVLVALKTSAGSGTAPTGRTLVGFWNQSDGGSATLNEQMTTFGTGNQLVILADGNQVAHAQQFTGLTDALGNSYSIYNPQDANAGYPNIALDCDIAAGNNLLKFTGVNTGATQNFFYMEWSGHDNTNHTSCYDSSAGTPVGYSATANPVTNMPSITPSTSGGTVIATSEMGTGAFPMSINAPSCGAFYVPQYPGQSDLSNWGLGNMLGYCMNTSTAAQSWSWTNDSTATAWQAIAIALKAPAAPTGVRRSLWLIR